MKKVTDLTPTELGSLAREAWSVAAQQALSAGQSITGSRDGRRIKYHPDGRIEDLGPVAELPKEGEVAVSSKSGRSVA
ncbi:hypothetical protein QA645_07865 [Bradyrhizobium sp. CIAT3101]|uniref:hypothetical protein n=1 Tax=Bradyrhizobium sp. CIAT3101 TaxID=439387 RepID=UPI0024B15F7E|nr:hypothetical protein [Bradyrhizobium sp. CIAT3101]WFU82638.1 hypothetical protein QA645_07865 [Bradyrhizobium sp. CIAT3101]